MKLKFKNYVKIYNFNTEKIQGYVTQLPSLIYSNSFSMEHEILESRSPPESKACRVGV